MTQVIKFPDMRPPSRARDSVIRELPAPAQYRMTTPAVLGVDCDVTKPSKKRMWAWFGIAVGLHAALFIAIWLAPPLRLKWTPSADAWVQVVSVPPAATSSPPKPAKASDRETAVGIEPLPGKAP